MDLGLFIFTKSKKVRLGARESHEVAVGERCRVLFWFPCVSEILCVGREGVVGVVKNSVMSISASSGFPGSGGEECVSLLGREDECSRAVRLRWTVAVSP